MEFGGINLQGGTYAGVEYTEYDEDEDAQASDIFIPITALIDGEDADGRVVRQFYLADVNAIVGPCVVVPDIGGPKNAYFQVKNMSSWAKDLRTG